VGRTGHTPFDDAVKRTRDALAQQGFGVLTEIDMKATLKAKLGEDMEDYLILGACSPPLAHRAVNVDRQIGLLLPCNVVVRTDPADESAVLVDAMNPQLLVDVTGEPELRPVADEVTTKLRAAINSMGASVPRAAPISGNWGLNRSFGRDHRPYRAAASGSHTGRHTGGTSRFEERVDDDVRR
jgi:uncharacterized protein (DUF302 family)